MKNDNIKLRTITIADYYKNNLSPELYKYLMYFIEWENFSSEIEDNIIDIHIAYSDFSRFANTTNLLAELSENDRKELLNELEILYKKVMRVKGDFLRLV